MTLIFAAIAPHGGLVFEQPDAPTRQGMDELARRFETARPEATIVVTPHGTLVDGHFGVVRSGRVSEHPNSFIAAEHLYDGPGDPALADACVRALQEDGLPALGLTFGWDRLADDDRGILPAAILLAPGGIWAWHDGFQGGK